MTTLSISVFAATLDDRRAAVQTMAELLDETGLG